ncbi:MAG: ATP-dependent RNA helicase DeaD [Myxococcota bacterium]
MRVGTWLPLELSVDSTAAGWHSHPMTDRSFSDFSLHPALIKATEALGYTAATPIQAATIEPLLAGKDVIARARTGSGKTAAFGLPLLHQVAESGPGPGPQALILAPTRELALQVAAALGEMCGELRIPIATVYGGAAYGPQLRALQQNVPIVVGTPGRMIDHLKRGSMDLSNVRWIVLDEADEMLRMGFIEDVSTLLSATPDTRQVALFSATMPRGVAKVAAKYQKDPVTIQVESGAMTTEHITQRWSCVPHRFKVEALTRVLDAEQRETTLVFARTRAGCAEVADALIRRGYGADALHGDMNQAARERVLHRLRSKWLRIVVATDVAARGIDIDHVTHVINLDLPDNAEPYVHRIGRTGRAGRMGTAITFVTPAERGRWSSFQKHIGARVELVSVPSDLEIVQRQRKAFLDTLLEVVDSPRWEDAQARFTAMSEGSEHTPEMLATAALELLHAERQMRPDRNPSADPPPWGRAPEQRRQAPQDKARPPQSRGATSSELFLAMGSGAGLRVGDVVGALTHGLKIPVSKIGRVNIMERKTFVTMEPTVLSGLIASVQTLPLRGKDVKIGASRGPGGPPPSNEGPDKAKRRFSAGRPPNKVHKPPRGRTKPKKR